MPRYNYRIGLPQEGWYDEVLNSDGGIYGGSNMGNNGRVYADRWSFHGLECSASLNLPPLSVLVLRPTPPPPVVEKRDDEATSAK